MRSDTISVLNEIFSEFPFLMGGEVSNEEILEASGAIEFEFPSDYVEFVRRYGGAMVGPYPVFGLRAGEPMGVDDRSVVEVTRRCRQQGVPGSHNWLIISRDHSGNPIGLGRDGSVLTWDHDFRQTMKLADSFEQYLRKECLKLSD